jgi:hypothetical protein
MAARSSVTVRSRFPAARAVVVEAASRAVAATGRAITADARRRMSPGYFYDTGLSSRETVWEQLSPIRGQVHIPTVYAAYPEFGTAHTGARPVLRPAIAALWPSALYGFWRQAQAGLRASRQVLDPLDPPGPPGAPIDRTSGGPQP